MWFFGRLLLMACFLLKHGDKAVGPPLAVARCLPTRISIQEEEQTK
jgi:hypothetical protein